MTYSPKKNVALLPVNLIVADTHTLVVGGGPVAARKIQSLLHAGAYVTCVCPDASPAVHQLATHPRMTLHLRRFTPEDVVDMFLVYATTHTRKVNAAVVAACRAHGILCGVVDKGWREGDLTAPATFTYDDLTFAISSGGRACRVSRALKRHLESYLDTCASAAPVVIGFEHDTAPPLSPDTLHEICSRLSRIHGVCECLPLHTCNRTEIYAIATADPVCADMMRTLFSDATPSPHSLYFLRDADAFRHATEVAAGMRAPLPGETHIIAQLKSAYDDAVTHGWADTLLRTFFDTILCVAKHVRTATEAYLTPCSLEELCRTHLTKISPQKETPRKILVAGSGMIGRELARVFLDAGAEITLCYHTHTPNLSDIKNARLHCTPLADMTDLLPQHETLICALRTDGYYVTPAHPAFATLATPLTIIDLSVPPAVDPAVATKKSCLKLYTLDDIVAEHGITDAALAAARKEAESVIAAYAHLYEHCKARMSFVPQATHRNPKR